MNKLELNKKTMQKLNKREMEQVNGGFCISSCKSGSAKGKKCCNKPPIGIDISLIGKDDPKPDKW